jgi:hypothetical protein
VRLDTPNGEAELPPRVIGAALNALAQRPHALAELAALPEMERTTPGELLAVLAGGHVAAPVWRAAPTPEMQARAQRYNRVLLHCFGADAVAAGCDLAVAAPMLGGGLSCKPVEVGTLLALSDAKAAGQPVPDAATIARGMLVADSAPDALAWTERVVAAALTERLPSWRSLGLL